MSPGQDIDKKHDSEPKKFTRTGEKDFVVEHTDGSQFHGVVDDKERFNSQLSGKSLRPPSSANKFATGVCLKECLNRDDKEKCGDNCIRFSNLKEKENGSERRDNKECDGERTEQKDESNP